MAAKKAIKHVGFGGAVSAVMKQGKSKAAAQKIIGSGKANASAAAKKANPRLLKKGKAAKKSSRGGY